MKHTLSRACLTVLLCVAPLAHAYDSSERKVRDLEEQVEQLKQAVSDLQMIARVHLGAIQRLNGLTGRPAKQVPNARNVAND